MGKRKDFNERIAALQELSLAHFAQDAQKARSLLLGKGPLRDRRAIEKWPTPSDIIGGIGASVELSEEGALEMLNVWLDAGYPMEKSLHVLGESQCAPMAAGAAYGRLKVIDWLLAAGASPDGASPQEASPLCNAARSGNWPMMEKLLKVGANPVLGQTGESPFEHQKNSSVTSGHIITRGNIIAGMVENRRVAELARWLKTDWGPWEKDKEDAVAHADQLMREHWAVNGENISGWRLAAQEERQGFWKTFKEERELNQALPQEAPKTRMARL